MVRKTILIVPLLATAASLSAQAPAESSYYVRNETSRTFSCGMRREPQRRVHRFLLRRGSDYHHQGSDGEMRTLLCDTRHPTQRFRMRPGTRYALVERAGYVTLRRLPDSPTAP
jgi:hypothetical protein